jgi:hypothetical protein
MPLGRVCVISLHGDGSRSALCCGASSLRLLPQQAIAGAEARAKEAAGAAAMYVAAATAELRTKAEAEARAKAVAEALEAEAKAAAEALLVAEAEERERVAAEMQAWITSVRANAFLGLFVVLGVDGPMLTYACVGMETSRRYPSPSL